MQYGATLRGLDETMPQMLHEAITDARAWKRETLSPEDWLVPLPARRAWLNWMRSCSFYGTPHSL